MNGTRFKKIEILSDLSFFCKLEYNEFCFEKEHGGRADIVYTQEFLPNFLKRKNIFFNSVTHGARAPLI